MENIENESCFGAVSTDFDPPYDIHDRTTLLKILSWKDEIIQQKSNDVTRLSSEIQKLKEDNTVLHEEVTKLNSQLCEDYSPEVKTEQRLSSHSQDGETVTEYGDKPMPDWNTSANSEIGLSISDVVRATAEAELNSRECEYDSGIVDSGILESGQDAGTNSEYVYDSSSGYYYHPPTGYYWDPNSGLFYDYTTCTYYQYNETNGEYEVHSQVDTESHSITSQKTKKTKTLISSLSKSSYAKTLSSLKTKECPKKRHKRRLSRKGKGQSSEKNNDEQKSMENDSNIKSQDSSLENVHDCGELRASDGESSGSLASDESELVSDPESGEIISSSSDVEMIEAEMPFQSEFETAQIYTWEQGLPEDVAMAENYPPCIRVIVIESEKLSAGILFIITCAGGTIGRDATKKHSIEIPDIGVSKNHARIEYDYDDSCYNVTDLGSQNGTWVNDKRVHQMDNDKQPLTHGDVLKLGTSTKLLFHIHKGHETCEECEPGQVQAKLKALNPIKNTHVFMTQEERKQNQKKELKKIKKKYGLQNCYFENEGAIVNDPDYADKAFLRRKFIGSDNDNVQPQSRPASVYCPIASSNKGHKLLAKMGWKEGQGLGKTNTGISEPINVALRVNQSSGLGSVEGHSLSLDHVQDSGKAKRWSQARKRFNQLQTENPPSDSQPQIHSNPTHHDTVSKNSTDSSNLLKNFQSDINVVPSSLPSSSSLSSPSSSLPSKPNPISKSKSQIKWHRGGTETLSNSGDSENKPS